ncbi:permease [marine bacterium AO1-C]|nr:permease [marine bacterium AO1-C]
MRNNKQIKEIIEGLRASEGDNFEYDEAVLFAEYQEQGENNATLSVKIFSIVGGLMAALAFLGFLLIAGLYKSEAGLLLFGLVFIVAALVLNKIFNKFIIDTFSVSIYSIGFVLFVSGLLGMDTSNNIITLLVIGIAVIGLFITQNYVLSFISILIINGGLLHLVFVNEVYNLIHLYIGVATLALTWCMLNEAKLLTLGTRMAKLYDPLRVGLIISLLYGLVIVGKKDWLLVSQNYNWISSAVIIPVVLYVVNVISDIVAPQISKNKPGIYLLSILVLAPTVFAPSISGAILIILLTFLVNYKTGLIIGVIAFIYFISVYYYDLSFSLLIKSMLLFSSGIVFLLFYLFTNKK